VVEAFITGLSTWRHEFDLGPAQVRFVVDNEALGQGCHLLFRVFFTVGIIPPKFHFHLSHICYQDLYNLSNCERRWMKRHHCSILTLILTLHLGRTSGQCLASSKQASALRHLRFLQQCFRSFRSSGMWRWVAGSVDTEVSNGHIDRSLLVQFFPENRGKMFLRNVG